MSKSGGARIIDAAPSHRPGNRKFPLSALNADSVKTAPRSSRLSCIAPYPTFGRVVWLTRSGFAEGEAVEFAVADLAGGDVFHFGRDKVDGTTDFFGPGLKPASNDGGALVGVADGALGFVDNDDFCARLGDPDHFFDGACLVREEVDAASVEDAVEGAGLMKGRRSASA